jgi:hypothetical protein
MRKAPSITIITQLKKQRLQVHFRDNPILDRLIEVGTKALRRGLMSGETLRAPRQQLRRLCASAFVLLFKSPAIARHYGARFVFGVFSGIFLQTTIRLLLLGTFAIQKSVSLIRKNLTSAIIQLIDELSDDPRTVFCSVRENSVA